MTSLMRRSSKYSCWSSFRYSVMRVPRPRGSPDLQYKIRSLVYWTSLGTLPLVYWRKWGTLVYRKMRYISLLKKIRYISLMNKLRYINLLKKIRCISLLKKIRYIINLLNKIRYISLLIHWTRSVTCLTLNFSNTVRSANSEVNSKQSFCLYQIQSQDSNYIIFQ